ncbi:TPA: hypothetical protein ACH3X1_015833 [Trebouxia sp. C0004]
MIETLSVTGIMTHCLLKGWSTHSYCKGTGYCWTKGSCDNRSVQSVWPIACPTQPLQHAMTLIELICQLFAALCLTTTAEVSPFGFCQGVQRAVYNMSGLHVAMQPRLMDTVRSLPTHT